ncbi:MAG: hypothetical protein ACO1OQ_00575 [Rufibacter sp.]
MSNERFDKQIKEKLEQVRPPFTPQAWEGFQQLLPTPWYAGFMAKYGTLLYSGASTIALVITLYFFMQEQAANQHLREAIAALQAKELVSDSLAQVSANNQTPVPGTPAAASLHSSVLPQNANPTPDTIFLVRKVYVTNSRTSNATGPALSSQPDVTAQQAGVSSGQMPAISLHDSSASALPKDETAHAAALVSTDSLRAPLAPAEVPAPAADSTQLAPLSDSTQIQKARAPWLHPRIGFMAQAPKGQSFSFGPTAEIFLGKQFSIGGGLLFSSGEKAFYSNTQQYNQMTGRKFENEFKDNIPGSDTAQYKPVLRQINFSTRTVRVPLSLNYYLPSKGNIAFLFMAGTTLDVTVYQNVDFISNYQSVDEYVRFEKKAAPVTLNNMVYGAGLQFTYGRLVAQLLPYYNYQIRTPEYISSEAKVGLNASMKINLSKQPEAKPKK